MKLIIFTPETGDQLEDPPPPETRMHLMISTPQTEDESDDIYP